MGFWLDSSADGIGAEGDCSYGLRSGCFGAGEQRRGLASVCVCATRILHFECKKLIARDLGQKEGLQRLNEVGPEYRDL